MSDRQAAVADTNKRKLSLDTWAVLIALAAAVLIRFGLIRFVPW
jgi:hypothetical protein